MVADADLQVWLDTQAQAAQTVIIPYVKSVRDVQVNFRMDVVQRGGAGTSRISQSGMVDAAAAVPTALARVTLSTQPYGECRVELSLREGGKMVGTYQFSCSPR